VTTYDAIVVGAGPAGSTTTRLLGEQGAQVLLLDRARFPRDKPCGGGITVQAARAAGVDISPVVERTVHACRVSFRQGRAFERRSSEPLTYMTQRRRLDEHLVACATQAGATFHDGAAVREIELTPAGAIVRANGDAYHTRTLVGADGANGVVARSVGLAPIGQSAVALEGNVPLEGAQRGRWEQTIALDFGDIPGGYGWLFPKGNHVNVGVGGWRFTGPTLRNKLRALCRYLELEESKLFGLRGHHLPMRAPGAPIARGSALLVGDAAGLVDPLSGEGIHAAFASGGLAAEAIGRYLAGETDTLGGYEASVDRELMMEVAVSTRLQSIFHRLPRPCIAVMRRSDRFWGVLRSIVRGETGYVDVRRKLGPFRFALDGVAKLSAPNRSVDAPASDRLGS
jgi:geranylgeranyl reductase family protein